MSSFAPGSLVSARGREWVVLPESVDDLVVLRPLGGTDAEICGILPELEEVRTATFSWPDPSHPGDFRSANLLRQALRLGFRSSAGPFRSFGSIAVEPRPYQLVPLLLALRQDVTRLLIADDIGIGKTVEALLVAAELLETGAAYGLAVLCPPHLVDQWRREMASKFHLNAEIVGPSTAPRLERGCAVGQTLFELYPYVIVSTDYIKSERRRAEFFRTCPDLVIVDEAHTCAADTSNRTARHQRHELVAGLAAKPSRHIVLVTGTPHSGNVGAFRSLVALLDPAFAELPDDLSGTVNEPIRRRLAAHLVQRRRPDIADYAEARRSQSVRTPKPPTRCTGPIATCSTRPSLMPEKP
jgi:SNF2 family DNA or RNA helicase